MYYVHRPFFNGITIRVDRYYYDYSTTSHNSHNCYSLSIPEEPQAPGGLELSSVTKMTALYYPSYDKLSVFSAPKD